MIMDPQQNAIRLAEMSPGSIIITYVTLDKTNILNGWRMFNVIAKSFGNTVSVEYLYLGSPNDDRVFGFRYLEIELPGFIFVKYIGKTNLEREQFSWDEFLQTSEAKWMKRANRTGVK
jgi:hypothetical protein